MSFCSSEAHLCRSAETPFAVLGFERSARAFSSPETQVHMPQAVFLNVTDVTLSRCGVRVISLAPEVPARGSAYSSWCKVRNSHGEITNRNLRTKSTCGITGPRNDTNQTSGNPNPRSPCTRQKPSTPGPPTHTQLWETGKQIKNLPGATLQVG